MKNSKNKLTMKNLQKQLNDLKVYKEKVINAKVDKVEQTVTKTTATHMKGFGFIPFHILSFIILNLNKVPIIRKLIIKVKPHLSKTGLWQILLLIRKIIIIFNAIIGVYVVYKTTGITSESILVNFIGMGNKYIEILTDFTKKIFSWFVELFDYKIIPKPGGGSWWKDASKSWVGGASPSTWHTKPFGSTGYLDILKGRDWYPSPLNLNIGKSDGMSWSTWFYLLGGITLITGIAASGYCIYSYYQVAPNAPPLNISGMVDTIKHALNPVNWWTGIRNMADGYFADPVNNAGNNNRVVPIDVNAIPAGARTPVGIGLQVNTDNTFMGRIFDKVRIGVIGNLPAAPHHVPGVEVVQAHANVPASPVLSSPSSVGVGLEMLERAGSPAEDAADMVREHWANQPASPAIPSSSVAGPSSSMAGPSSSMAGPSSSMADPSNVASSFVKTAIDLSGKSRMVMSL